MQNLPGVREIEQGPGSVSVGSHVELRAIPAPLGEDALVLPRPFNVVPVAMDRDAECRHCVTPADDGKKGAPAGCGMRPLALSARPSWEFAARSCIRRPDLRATPPGSGRRRLPSSWSQLCARARAVRERKRIERLLTETRPRGRRESSESQLSLLTGFRRLLPERR